MSRVSRCTGVSACVALLVCAWAPVRAEDFSDDFERADGPLAGSDWTVNAGDWNLVGGQLVAGPAGPVEQQAFVGDPPIATGGAYTIEFDWNFIAPADSQPVGRHAGVLFEFNQPGARGDPATSGYQLWWIDRASDRGFTLARWDGAGFATLNPPGGTGGLFADVPSRIRIEVSGAQIQVFGDDTLAIDVEDNTYRGGNFGLWTWSGAGQHVEFDNVTLTAPETILSACSTISEPTITACPLTFDGSCSISEGGGDIVRHTWDFGDGSGTVDGAVVEHTYAAGGDYTVSLTIENELGQTDVSEKQICVNEVTLDFSDDFTGPDGPVTGWTVFSGDNWRIEGNRVVSGPSNDGGGDEYWIWAGDKPLYTPGIVEFEFDVEFLAPGNNGAVGRHGGFQFHCSPATRRGAGFSGYFIDWIDRASDRGVRLTKYTNGAAAELVRGQGEAATADPPSTWRVVTTGSQIQVFGDETLLIDHEDSTHRGGFFGFWTWEFGQEIAYDNLTVNAEPINPCLTVSNSSPLEGEEITFDAGCTKSFAGDIVSHEWDFGDGSTGSGAAVSHTYAIPDVYNASVVIMDSEGNSTEISKTISVRAILDTPYQDCFERDDGAVEGWSIDAGTWQIAGGALEGGPTTGGGQAGEHQIYVDDPVSVLPTDCTISFNWEFLSPADSQPVGRHAGVYFNFNQPGIRWDAATSGYQLWWIDRNSDRGLTLARWDGAGFAALNPPGGTGGLFTDSPRNIRIEIDGENIRVYGDEVLAIDVVDNTYRNGVFGLWAWDGATQHVRFDDVRVWTPGDEAPEPCETSLVVAGDCSSDGVVNVGDVMCMIGGLFPGFVLLGDVGSSPCDSAAGNTAVNDVNDDGSYNISDIVFLANFLFGEGDPPIPGVDCSPVPATFGCADAATCI